MHQQNRPVVFVNPYSRDWAIARRGTSNRVATIRTVAWTHETKRSDDGPSGHYWLDFIGLFDLQSSHCPLGRRRRFTCRPVVVPWGLVLNWNRHIDGHLCGCGARGCFEQYASGNALLRHAREAINASPEVARNLLSRGDGTVAGLTGQAITDAARDGDPVALAAFNTTGQWLGAGIASLAVLLDPACVVIGGGVIDAGEILLKPTRESLERNMPFAGKHPYPQIIAAQLGNEAGLVGVADLARS